MKTPWISIKRSIRNKSFPPGYSVFRYSKCKDVSFVHCPNNSMGQHKHESDHAARIPSLSWISNVFLNIVARGRSKFPLFNIN